MSLHAVRARRKRAYRLSLPLLSKSSRFCSVPGWPAAALVSLIPFSQCIAVAQSPLVSILRNAEALESAGRLADAKVLLTSAEKQFPHNASLHFELGTLALQQEDWPAAVQALRLAAKENPRDPDTLFYLGQAYYQNGDSSLAVTTLEQGARLAPRNAAMAQKRGEYLCNSDPNCVKGLQELRRAQTLDPTLDGIDFDIGIAEYKNRQVQPAEQSFEAELHRSPRNAEAEFYLGELFGLSGDWKNAKEHYLQAIEDDPTKADAYYGAGHCTLALGDAAAAIPFLRKALEVNPSLLNAHYQLALAYRKMKQPEQAAAEMALFKAAHEKEQAESPVVPVRSAQDEKAWEQIRSLVDSGNESALISNLKSRDLQKNLPASSIGLELGMVYYTFDKPQSAIRVLQHEVAVSPQNADAHAWLGRSLLLGGRSDDAQAELLKAFALAPGNQIALLGLGQLNYAQGHWSIAARYLEDSRIKQPEVLVKLCDAYSRAGQAQQVQMTAELVHIFAPDDSAAIAAVDRIASHSPRP